MSEIRIETVVAFLESLAPMSLAEDWDNVGLLVGRREARIDKIMTCLTLTSDCAEEAIEAGAGLIITHHPLPFRSLKRITGDDETGRILLNLIQAGIGVFSAHTCFDSATNGINQQIAEGLGLTGIKPLVPKSVEDSQLGAGRYGNVRESLTGAEWVDRVKTLMSVGGLHVVGDLQRQRAKVGVACGAAGSFLEAAVAHGCDVFLTGETNFHTCLDARAKDILLILPVHYASERFALETLADDLNQEFDQLECWASRSEADPLAWVG